MNRAETRQKGASKMKKKLEIVVRVRRFNCQEQKWENKPCIFDGNAEWKYSWKSAWAIVDKFIDLALTKSQKEQMERERKALPKFPVDGTYGTETYNAQYTAWDTALEAHEAKWKKIARTNCRVHSLDNELAAMENSSERVSKTEGIWYLDIMGAFEKAYNEGQSAGRRLSLNLIMDRKVHA
jgi:hypothetical protein